MATWTKEALEYLAEHKIPVDKLEASLKDFMGREIGGTQPLFQYYPTKQRPNMTYQPCVAALATSKKEPILATGSGHVECFKNCPTYLEWLLNESPWAECYLLKDLKDVYKFGVVCRTDKPANFLMQALIVPRHFNEYNCAIETSDTLMKDYGFDGHLATMVGVNYHVRDGAVYQNQIGGHNALKSSGNEKYWQNFVDHNGVIPEAIYIKGNGYRCIDNYWGNEGGAGEYFIRTCMKEAEARLENKPKVNVTAKDREVNPWVEKIQEIKALKKRKDKTKHSLDVLPALKEVLTEKFMR